MINKLFISSLSPDNKKIEGDIKVTPTDFIVKEILSYSPCHQGQHLYLEIKKEEQNTDDVISRLSKCFSISKSKKICSIFFF